MALNLNAMPRPKKDSSKCSVDQLPDIQTASQVELVSLFDQKRLRGFWPTYNEQDGTRVLAVSTDRLLQIPN